MSIAAKCTCGYSVSGICTGRPPQCRNVHLLVDEFEALLFKMYKEGYVKGGHSHSNWPDSILKQHFEELMYELNLKARP